MALIPRISFFFYWFLDTLIVLIKIKVLNNGWDLKGITRRWAQLWTIANFVGILGAIVELVEIGKEEVNKDAMFFVVICMQK